MTAEDRDERGEFWELPDEENADVKVFTSVRADELRFESVPNKECLVRGRARREVELEDRTGQPADEVEAGVAYRDIGVRWRARSRIVHPSDPSET